MTLHASRWISLLESLCASVIEGSEQPKCNQLIHRVQKAVVGVDTRCSEDTVIGARGGACSVEVDALLSVCGAERTPAK